MSALVADVAFDFTFSSPSPSPSLDDPATPPLHGVSLDGSFSLDAYSQNLLQHPDRSHNALHAPSSSTSKASFATVSALDSISDTDCSRFTTPQASPPVRQHGPLLLPRIRPQDQEIDPSHDLQILHARRASASAASISLLHQTTPPPAARNYQSHHGRSYTSPDITSMAFAHMSPFATPPPAYEETTYPSSLLCSPANIAQDSLPPSRRASCSVDTSYRQIILLPSTPTVLSHSEYVFPSASFLPRPPSPPCLPAAVTSEMAPSTTLMSFLTAPNPAASLVRTISFPLRDPSIKHFWWDIRNIRSWANFNTSTILSFPGATSLLSSPVSVSALPTPAFPSRHPETEAALYGIYASFYLPKLNTALAISYNRPLQLSIPAKSASGVNDFIFVANAAGESSTAATMFGGKPTARVVGLVRSFSRFNTGMRSEGNIKRVDYLRGLAALHHAMREHGCRYGFILTEIELVVVRAGTDNTPYFGDVEMAAIQLSAAAHHDQQLDGAEAGVPLTACLALWGLCQLAGDVTPAGHAPWKADIGAPAEGTRRKAKPRDNWIPQPQLAEKREAKRSRGWVWPEDAIGRKELGKRGIKYGGI